MLRVDVGEFDRRPSELFVELGLMVLALSFSVSGSVLGACSGMTPGLHVNTLSLLLVSSYPLLEPSVAGLCSSCLVDPVLAPLLVACFIVSAAVTHSFVDFVPSVFLGVPEEGTVLSILPGHRLVLAGRGLEAVRCAATGSLVGALIAVILVLPLQTLMLPPFQVDSLIKPGVPFLLLAVSVALVLSEGGRGGSVACLDSRKGRCTAVPGLISIVAPVPIDGEDVTIVGMIVRRGAIGKRYLRTAHGEFPLRTRASLPEGRVRLEGRWLVRKRYAPTIAIAGTLFLLSGALGFAVMNGRVPGGDVFPGLGQSMLLPLLTGLFGFPTLLLSARSGSIPEQVDGEQEPVPVGPAVLGTLGGFLAGWLPGITSTAATVVFAPLAPGGRRAAAASAKRFIVSVSAVGTASAVFSILAFALLGKVRSGAMMAVQQLIGNGTDLLALFLPLFLLSVLVSSALGYRLTILLASKLAPRLSGMRLGLLNRFLLFVLVILVMAFTGVPGLLVLGAATLLGLLPPKLGLGRVQLTGCLLLPITLALFGLDGSLADLLSGLPHLPFF